MLVQNQEPISRLHFLTLAWYSHTRAQILNESAENYEEHDSIKAFVKSFFAQKKW